MSSRTVPAFQVFATANQTVFNLPAGVSIPAGATPRVEVAGRRVPARWASLTQFVLQRGANLNDLISVYFISATEFDEDDKVIGSASLNFPSIAASGGAQVLTLLAPGAAVGDVAIVAPAAVPAAGITWDAWVSAANTVSIRLTNTTAAAIDPPDTVWRAVVLRP